MTNGNGGNGNGVVMSSGPGGLSGPGGRPPAGYAQGPPPPFGGEPEREGLTLRDYLAVISRRWWIIALVVVVATASAYYFANRQPKQYSASATIIYKQQLDLANPLNSGYTDTMGIDREMASINDLLASPDMQTRTDAILAEASARSLTIAVAHQMRLAPPVVRLRQAVADGLLGDLLALHAAGKQDARAGGEDMMVLGTHLFDLLRLFAGDPEWCTARVLVQGRDATAADARATRDDVGPVAGDEIDAQFAFPRGVLATFTSRGRLRETAGRWGVELVGSKGRARILCDIPPHVLVLKPGAWAPEGRADAWAPLPGAEEDGKAGGADAFAAANRRVVDDWLDAIAKGRQPACGGSDGAKAVEMVMAVYHAALGGGRVRFPLAVRAHPLAIR